MSNIYQQGAHGRGVGAWLQRWWGGRPSGGASEADRLAALQSYLRRELQPVQSRLSPRDRLLMARVMAGDSLAAVRRLRFDCFDLMCRMLGEGTAHRHQRRIDGWLGTAAQPRHMAPARSRSR